MFLVLCPDSPGGTLGNSLNRKLDLNDGFNNFAGRNKAYSAKF